MLLYSDAWALPSFTTSPSFHLFLVPLTYPSLWDFFSIIFSFLLYVLGISLLSSTTDQFSSVTQSCPNLCDSMDRSMSGLPVHQQLPEFNQTHVHWVGDAIQPSHSLLSPSPPALNLSQQQGLLKWVSHLHQVAKVLEFQLQHQSSN